MDLENSFEFRKLGQKHVGWNRISVIMSSHKESAGLSRVSKFYNSLSFGAKQNALQQILFALWFF